MEDVARQGRTVLFVSHNMAAVRSMCSQAILLRDGRYELSGATEMVIAHYLAANITETAATVALPRGSPDAAGEATRLHFCTLDGTPKIEFRLGEVWRIELDIVLHRFTEHVIAAVGLLTLDSFPITTLWSKPKDLGAGQYRVSFECRLPLASTNLQFVVGISSHERTFYYEYAPANVAISEIAHDEQPVRAAGSGLLLSPQIAEIQPI
jgi:lipopolysaccharide transport system ATP-binding protein